MKFTPTQQKIVDELAASPLAWVGSTGSFKIEACVVLPANDGLIGSRMKDSTRAALIKKGVLKHGALSDEQKAEFNKRKATRQVRRSTPSHGYLFVRPTENKTMKKEFTGTEDWEAVRKAEEWCAENGISVGTMQAGSPRGLKRGQFSIAKWRNLDRADIEKLDGTMYGNERHGPVTVELKDE